MMRYFPTYLIYAAVLARALGWSQDSTPIPFEVWILLILFGVVMVSEPPLTRRFYWYPKVYTTVQSLLVMIMLYRGPTLDILTMLFLPLSFQAVRFFGDRIGFAWIGAYSLAMTGLFLIGLSWEQGVIMLLLSTGSNCLMGSYAHLMARTEQHQQENQQLYGELQDAYTRLIDSAVQADALAAAEERHRLARELHDSLTQTLFSMNLAVETARSAGETDPSGIDEHLERLQILARNAIGEVKTLTGQAPMHSPPHDGLAAALRSLAQERKSQDGLEVVVEVSGSRVLPAGVYANLYGIVQEALNNVIRHSGVRQAHVRLKQEVPCASLEVSDAGCGFDPATLDTPKGYGLVGMSERVNEIGWELEIESHPGLGTRVLVREKPS
jgi:signal transduction histidine kinase